ncbi:MAG TPA: hypothetical protein VKR06_00960 [Ktedonosporobacter sp.]|nr:hypothetical protein [Ktedonosporobacter sp.]
MEFAVDIDGTIASTNAAALLDHLREALRLPLLDVPEDIMWHEVFTLPEVLAYKKAHRKRYQRIYENYPGSPLVLRAAVPKPGSVETLNRLAQRAPVRYVTCRGGDLLIEETTKWWLAKCGYPNSDEVTFCPGFEHKLFALMRLPGPQVVMIDDRAHEIAEALYLLEKRVGEDPRGLRMLDQARRKLTLIFFGQNRDVEAFTFPGVRMLALPSWDGFDEVCGDLLQEHTLQGV